MPNIFLLLLPQGVCTSRSVFAFFCLGGQVAVRVLSDAPAQALALVEDAKLDPQIYQAFRRSLAGLTDLPCGARGRTLISVLKLADCCF